MNFLIKILKIFSTVIFCFYLLWFSNDRNYINYDAIPYSASAYLIKGSENQKAFEYSWNLLKESSSPELYQDLCCANKYRKSMSANESAFMSHLPSYQTKSGYIFLIRILSDSLNTNELQAIKIISQASAVLIVLLFSIFFFNARFLLYLSIFPILIFLEILQLSRLMTPDALIGFFMLLSAYFLTKNNLILSYFTLLISILFRQTNILVIGMLCLVDLYKKNYFRSLIFAFISLCLYFLNSINFESIGYWKTFHSSLIQMPVTFVDYDPYFSFSIYLNLLIDKIIWILSDAHLSKLIFVILINLIIGISFISNESPKGNFGKLILIYSLGVFLGFLLIPFPDFRIYAGPLIASTFLILESIRIREDSYF